MASIIEKMKKNVMCPVCQDPLKKPKLLLCSHRLCTECLRGIIQTMGSEGIVKCPSCRLGRNISTLVANNPQTDRVTFFPDDSPTAETVRDVQALKTELCKEHNDLCCIYCQDCSIPLCFVCYKQDHMNHTTCSLKDQAETQRLEYKQQLDSYSGTAEVLAKGELTANAFQLNQYYDDAAQAVRVEYQKVQKLVKDMEKQVTDQIKADRDRKVEDFCKSEKKQVDRITCYLKDVYNNPSNVAVVSKEVKKQIVKLESQQIPRPNLPNDLEVNAVNLSRVKKHLADISPGIPLSSGESSQTFAVPFSNSKKSEKRKGKSHKNEPKHKRVYPPATPSPCSSSPPNSPVSVRIDTESEDSD